MSDATPHPNGNGQANGQAHKIDPRTGFPLLPNHVADLRKSGLNDDTIRACGFYTVKGSGRIQELMGWPLRIGGSALAIPYHDAEGQPALFRGPDGQPLLDEKGQPLPYTRLRSDKPRKIKGKKDPAKYESRSGSQSLPYFPPGTLAALKDPSQPLLITEGEKKAAKAAQDGFPCVGLAGVDCWSKPRPKGKNGKPKGERELSAELAAIPWQNRPVFIVYDSDLAEKSGVQWAEWNLAQELAGRGAIVKAVRLPPGPPDAEGKPAKVGLDDFLVGSGPDAFRAVLDEAIDPERPQPREDFAPDIVNEADDDPHRLARLFLTPGVGIREPVPAVDPAKLSLRWWREDWIEHDGHAYRQLPQKEVAARLTASVKAEYDRLNIADLAEYAKRKATKAENAEGGEDKEEKDNPPQARKVTTRLMGDVRQALAGLTMLPASVQPPDWLNGDGPFPADEVLAAQNTLVHLPSLVSGRPVCSCEPTLNYFSLNALNYDYVPSPPKPQAWLTFLGQLWPDDPEAGPLLQEWFGYCLTPDTRQQKMLLIIGPKRSGKGTIARVLRALIGPENVAGPTLSSFGMNFGLWPLLGKSAAIVSDARLSGGRRDQDVIVERLLSISGEDSLTVDRKNLEPVTTKLLTRLTILTNELPRLGDSSGALTSRFLMLHTPRSWYGQEDTGLSDRLLGELPGILVWAIEGWQRLRGRGRFVQPASGRELIEEMEDLSSPVGEFVKTCCFVGPDQQVPRKDLYARFKTWCEDSKGTKNPPTESTFGRDLHAACPSVRTARPRQDGDRQRVYQGIGLIPTTESY
jgi:putative DNA primase/helicase